MNKKNIHMKKGTQTKKDNKKPTCTEKKGK